MAQTSAERQRRYIERLKARAAAALVTPAEPAAAVPAAKGHAARIKQLEAENARLHDHIARLEADPKHVALRRERDALAEQLAQVRAFAPKLIDEAAQWTRTH